MGILCLQISISAFVSYWGNIVNLRAKNTHQSQEKTSLYKYIPILSSLTASRLKKSFQGTSRPHNGNRTVSSTNGVGKTGYPHTQEWSWTFTLHRMQTLTQNGMNIRSTIIKLLGENIRENISDILFSYNFLNVTPKAQTIKAKIGKSNADTSVHQRK